MIDTCDKTWYFEIMAQRHYDQKEVLGIQSIEKISCKFQKISTIFHEWIFNVYIYITLILYRKRIDYCFGLSNDYPLICGQSERLQTERCQGHVYTQRERLRIIRSEQIFSCFAKKVIYIKIGTYLHAITDSERSKTVHLPILFNHEHCYLSRTVGKNISLTYR